MANFTNSLSNKRPMANKLSNNKRKFIKRQASRFTPSEMAAKLKLPLADVLAELDGGSGSRQPREADGRAEPGYYLFLAIVVLSPLVFTTLFYDFENIPRSLLLQAGALLIPVVWLLKPPPGGERTLYGGPLALPLLLLTAWALLSVTWSRYQFGAFSQWVHWAACVLTYFVALNIHRQLKAVKRTLQGLLIPAVCCSVLGILQFLVGFDWVPQQVSPAATFNNKNMAAQFVVMTFPICFVFAATSQDKCRTWLYALATSLVAVFGFYARSRAAWLALLGELLLIGVGLLLLGRSPDKKTILDKNRGLAFAAALGIFLFFTQLGPLSSSPAPGSAQPLAIQKIGASLDLASTRHRLVLWKNTLSMIAEHPLVGVGIRNVQVYYPVSPDKRYHRLNLHTQRVHNDYLQMVAELGLPVLLFLGWALFLILKTAVQVVRAPLFSDYGPYFLICLGAMLGLAINAGFSFPFNRALPPFLLAVYLGLYFRLSRMAQPADPSAVKRLNQKTVRSGAVAFVILFSAWAWTSYHWARADYYYRQHLVAFLSGDNSTAAHCGQKALAANPGRGAVMRSLSRVYVRQEDYVNAERLFGRIDRVFPHSALNLYHQAVTRINRKRYSDAENAIRKGLVLIPHSAKLHGLQGVVYQARQQAAEAIREYRQAIVLAPEAAIHYEWLGGLLYAEQQLEEAARVFARLRELEPGRPAASLALGRISMLQFQRQPRHPSGEPGRLQLDLIPEGEPVPDADLARARDYFGAILAVDPQHADANNALAVVQLYQGRIEQGTARLCQVLRRRADHRLARDNLRMMSAYPDPQVQAAAVACYLDLVGRHPRNMEFNHQLGLVLLRRGEAANAEAHLSRAVQLAPGSAVLHRNLGVALAHQGKLAAAAGSFRTAVDKSGGQDALAHNNLGSVLARQNQMEAAVGHFQKALDIDPGYQEARVNLQQASGLLKQSE